MKKTILIFLSLFFGQVYSKPYTIDLDKVMKTSKYTGEIIVLAYDLNPDSTFKSIKVAPYANQDSVFYITKVVPDDFRALPRTYFKKTPLKNKKHADLWFYWPDINERILIILDSTGALVLFGEINGDKYRLFGHLFTGSATGIYSKYLFQSPLKTHKQSDGTFIHINVIYVTRQDIKTKWTA